MRDFPEDSGLESYAPFLPCALLPLPPVDHRKNRCCCLLCLFVSSMKPSSLRFQQSLGNKVLESPVFTRMPQPQLFS